MRKTAAAVLALLASAVFADGGAAEHPSRALTDRDVLHTDGPSLCNPQGEKVVLRGVNVCSLEWSVNGEHVAESFDRAIDDWRANCIRLPVSSAFWFGEGEKHNRRTDGGEGYRKLVDSLVASANERGCYVVVDLHEYKAPTARHVRFWTDCAKRYANRPGVLFDLLNEPHGISWEVWRNGGELKDGSPSVGMQKLLETVRDAGAKNVVIAGGLDWAYDLRGVIRDGFALADPNGNGVMYGVHVYPWKGDWQGRFLDCAARYPVFVGEVGCQREKMPWEKHAKDPAVWAPKVLDCIRTNRLSWTAWSFHPKAGPCLLSDWTYTPTSCWGAYVRAELRGETH